MRRIARVRSIQRVRRSGFVTVACLGAASFAVASGAAGSAASAPLVSATAPAACWDDVGTDLDGGGPDVVIGLPSYDLPGKPDAGALVVFSNVAEKGEADPRPPTARRVVTADDLPGLSSQAGARFGAAVTVWGDTGDFDDADHCADLLVGVPGQNVAGAGGAGQVVKLKGAPGGLSEVLEVYDEATLPGTGGAQPGAGFGSTIASETLGMIAIGVPGRDHGSVRDAGQIVLLDYSATGSTAVTRVVRQGSPGAGVPEAGDRFGEVLQVLPTGKGPVLLAGVPREDVGSRADAGVVMLLPPDGGFSQVHQNSPGAGGDAEAGDRYGASLTGFFTFTTHPVGIVAIGVPGEDFSGRTNAGSVAFAAYDFPDDFADPFEPIRGLPRTVTQNTARVPGAAESGDAFGSAVLSGEFGRDSGEEELVVGAPGEDLGSASAAGMLTGTQISPGGVPGPASRATSWHQNSPSVAGVAEDGDRFASKLARVVLTSLEDDEDDIWDVVITTVPGEDVAGVADAGTAYLGIPPGLRAVPLPLPVRQKGAGTGMVPMNVG